MTNETQVAIITGGASGIRLAVAEALTARKGWTVDVTDYSSLAIAFNSIFQAHKKLNFVFANAGIAMHTDYYEIQDTEADDQAPPALDLLMIDINLNSVIATSYLAQHYFRLSATNSGPRNLMMTASSAGFYASPMAPMYCTSNHGVVGWARSIASRAWRKGHVRVNATCPGIVRTNILPAEVFTMCLEQLLNPVSKVIEVVLMLLDGDGAWGSDDGPLFGQTVEICGKTHYLRKQPDYCDSTMQALMSATDVDE